MRRGPSREENCQTLAREAGERWRREFGSCTTRMGGSLTLTTLAAP
ncbi:MAG: hypothetical protein AB7F59_07630 [Bdellovibrionales bacterium]